ncbi:hypothetical protein Sru01_38440 [Sphaerisporangium rufum]|uniref:Uncharacterized protein n=1 Tax=Sphaerisporangium rufum TaxID=1381558 RepID=A0A919R7X6_9ACTN|nr:hypothetical protein [Sphaerisporangium rufum]GII78862.1 hypothetical protein Sru01_38440 [Sphaerisporangium rufum]
MPDNTLPHDELRATVEARRDLGPEYDNALIESFLHKMDAAIDTRIRQEVAAQQGGHHPGGHHGYGGPVPPQQPRKQTDPTIPVALGSLGIGVPLTAIAADASGMVGLLITWIGIVLVNMAVAVGRRRH